MPETIRRHDRVLTRRQALARGVAVGGAVWTVPAISVVSMTSAHAAEPSPVLKPPEKPPVDRPPFEKPPKEKPPVDEPPVAGPPTAKKPPTVKKPPTDEPPSEETVAVPELPKTGADGVATSVAVGLGFAATGAAFLGAARKTGAGTGEQDTTPAHS